MTTIGRAAKCRPERTIIMETIQKKAANLISVKSLVTLVLTIVFAVQTCRGQVSQDFLTIYAVIIAFYFGTQAQKSQSGPGGEAGHGDL